MPLGFPYCGLCLGMGGIGNLIAARTHFSLRFEIFPGVLTYRIEGGNIIIAGCLTGAFSNIGRMSDRL